MATTINFEYDPHVLETMAMILKKLKQRAKKNEDNVSLLWLEQLSKRINGGFRGKKCGN